MNRTRNLVVFSAFLLTAVAAGAQTPRYRMMRSTDVGWMRNSSQVTCTDTGGFTHWNARNITFHLNPAGDGAGKETGIDKALLEWSSGNVANTDFQLGRGANRSGDYEQGDGYNMMVWDTDPICDSSSCHAITALLLDPGQVIRETDILFNDDATLQFQWKTDDAESSPSCWLTAGSQSLRIDTQAIATHEIGHALGIDHPQNFPTTAATMGQKACLNAGRSLETDDENALRCSVNRYPYNPSYQGSLDQATCDAFSGWARNANHDYETSYVEFVEKLSTGFLNVVAVVPAGGAGHTFSWIPPFTDGKWHKIRARYSGGAQASLAADKDIICEAPQFPDNMRASQYLCNSGQSPCTTPVVYTVGTQFSSTHSGKITRLGFLWALGETGSHSIQLLSDTDDPLSPPMNIIAPSNPPRWTWVTLPAPVAISANTLYRVVVNTNYFQAKSPCGTTNSLQTPYTNGPLTAHQGLWKGPNDPEFTGSCSNFFVNVKFST